MTTDSANGVRPVLDEPSTSVEELIEAAGAHKIRSIGDIQALAIDVFESDEELDEFIRFTYANRHQEVFD
ncbi:hypothetical protein Q0Z83_102540 [Actinoplanes sichuanensis]|uniref:Uncharacterized protein n=1 Tax=Actinoplanes sichuanensis TaxID=512349 RepID=A0ABW4AJF3_9ACTN|nr:hypothetical protein [Actinoplanes sichuanensis]BEL12063.1 hypothetical protein Q0Z83_102540 [Actinoplanes sichuanensis]